MADAPITFLVATKVFGPGPVPLGSVTTDKTGIARLTLGGDADHLYQPTENGPHEFVASYTADGAQPLQSSTNVNVTVARSAYHPAPDKPLAGAGTILVKALVLIVATIWLLLITQAVRVRRACVGTQQPTTGSA